jgi:hypothetical protein
MAVRSLIGSPLERVDKLIEECMSEVGQYPATVTVMGETWDWFSEQAVKGTDTRIRFEKGLLMYGGIRIKRRPS